MNLSAEAVKLGFKRGQIDVQERLQTKDRKVSTAGWRLNLAALWAEKS
jgi:hypothetical protein